MATVYELKSWLTAVDAEKPGGDHAGREIVCTDTGKKYRWNGASWTQLAGPHAAMHASGAADQLSVTALAFPGGSTFLRADGVFAAPPAGSATTVEVDIGAVAAFRGKFTITDAAITGTSKVLCWQAPGPYTGKGTQADEAEMQPVSVIAVEPATGSAVVKWQTPPMTGDARSAQVGQYTAAGATFDRLDNQRWPDVNTPVRIGRVRGNVKFSYMVL